MSRTASVSFDDFEVVVLYRSFVEILEHKLRTIVV
jgi:hypothetical protein